MSDLILHHYEASPFAEKIRIALGAKRLRYRAVRIPAVMPKPDVVALTGGYRKTPLLQVGNHIYCDTSLIVRVLDARHPQTPLAAGPVVETFAQWADSLLFDMAVSIGFRPSRPELMMQLMRPEELAVFLDDRAAMGQGARRSPPPNPTARAQLPIYAHRLEAMLADRPFLFGAQVTVADLSAYHPFWFVSMTTPELLDSFVTLRAWMERVAAFGHGEPEPLGSAEALDICRSSHEPIALPPHDAAGLHPGQAVRVRPTDMGREVTQGTLLFANETELAITHQDPRAGEPIVHFPRLGYDVIPG